MVLLVSFPLLTFWKLIIAQITNPFPPWLKSLRWLKDLF